jgi:hypothetical protein
MVPVVIDGREYRVPRRVVDVLLKVVEHADRIAEGSKILRLALRKEKITASIEEEL